METNFEDDRCYISVSRKPQIHYPMYLPSRSSRCNSIDELFDKIKETSVLNLEIPKYSKKMTDKKNKPENNIPFIISTTKELAIESVKCAINNGKKYIKVKLI